MHFETYSYNNQLTENYRVHLNVSNTELYKEVPTPKKLGKSCLLKNEGSRCGRA